MQLKNKDWLIVCLVGLVGFSVIETGCRRDSQRRVPLVEAGCASLHSTGGCGFCCARTIGLHHAEEYSALSPLGNAMHLGVSRPEDLS